MAKKGNPNASTVRSTKGSHTSLDDSELGVWKLLSRMISPSKCILLTDRFNLALGHSNVAPHDLRIHDPFLQIKMWPSQDVDTRLTKPTSAKLSVSP